MNVLLGTSASIRDVQGGAKKLHQLLLIVGEVSPHDIHARSQQMFKSSYFENCRKKKKKKKKKSERREGEGGGGGGGMRKRREEN